MYKCTTTHMMTCEKWAINDFYDRSNFCEICDLSGGIDEVSYE